MNSQNLTYDNIESLSVGWAARELVYLINNLRKTKNMSIHDRPDLKIDFPLMDFIEATVQIGNEMTFEMKMTMACAIASSDYSSILIEECLLNSVSLTNSIDDKETTFIDFSTKDKSATILINFKLNTNSITA